MHMAGPIKITTLHDMLSLIASLALEIEFTELLQDSKVHFYGVNSPDEEWNDFMALDIKIPIPETEGLFSCWMIFSDRVKRGLTADGLVKKHDAFVIPELHVPDGGPIWFTCTEPGVISPPGKHPTEEQKAASQALIQEEDKPLWLKSPRANILDAMTTYAIVHRTYVTRARGY